jgi:hypothetical protein
MSKPIYADPIDDGAADPAVIHRRGTDEWWMFYTGRRAHHPGAGLEWIHGTSIGIAVSNDGGISWAHRGTLAGLDDPAHPGRNTHWAPEVVFALGEYHMYLSYIVGVPDAWAGHERRIVHLTSLDLVSWTRRSVLELSSRFVIDACVYLCPDGLWRLWYKDEADGASTWAATSTNLYDWTIEGRVIAGKPGGNPHEGPNVFALGGFIWMIVDEWHGQAVYRSPDARDWTRQGLILKRPGTDPADRQYARHADVVVQDGWAALFYFTHPNWDESMSPAPLTHAERRTTIHAARLTVREGVLVCERDVGPMRLEVFEES